MMALACSSTMLGLPRVDEELGAIGSRVYTSIAGRPARRTPRDGLERRRAGDGSGLGVGRSEGGERNSHGLWGRTTVFGEFLRGLPFDL